MPTYPSATSASTPEIGRDLARLMQKNRAVAMRGHGIVVAGETLQEAFARALGEVTYLGADDVRLPPPEGAQSSPTTARSTR